MKLQELVNYIADNFQKIMEEEKFETFLEMKRCYWWKTKDIQDEVDYMIFNELHLDCDNRYNYPCIKDNNNLTYSKLIRKVYKELDNRNCYCNEYDK